MRFIRIIRLLSGFLIVAGSAALMSGCHHTEAVRLAPSALPIRFVDVADGAGLRYRWTIPGPHPLNILQTIGNGGAFLDYDNSGNLSILLVGTDHIALFKGDGHGHFTDVSRRTGLDQLRGHFLGVAVGDYDGDGYDDIYISGYRTGLLLHNEKGKRFRDVTKAAGLKPQPWGTSCAFAETVPGSGRLDLFVCNYLAFGPDPQKYPQLCLIRGRMTACGPDRYGPAKDVFYRNVGHGHFTEVSRSSGMLSASGKGLGVACAPLDGSGRPFIAVANDEMPGDLLRPDVASTHYKYKDIGAASGIAFDRNGNIHGGMGTDWGDYDNDGKMDLVVATYHAEPKCLYHNEGDAQFTEVSQDVGLARPTLTTVAFGVKFCDFDNDGWLDLMLADGHLSDNISLVDASTTYRQPTQLFRNDHGRLFTGLSDRAEPDLQRPIVGRGLAVGDFDNDGRMDALVVDSEGTPLLLHNESQNAWHWLSLTLIGTKSNRDGYGALVTVRTPGLTQTRLCHADGSYLSSSDKRVHVGLGAATQAQALTVRWPDGHMDAFHTILADRFYTLREGNRQLL